MGVIAINCDPDTAQTFDEPGPLHFISIPIFPQLTAINYSRGPHRCWAIYIANINVGNYREYRLSICAQIGFRVTSITRTHGIGHSPDPGMSDSSKYSAPGYYHASNKYYAPD